KAVQPGYPLRGGLRIADAAYGEVRRTDAIPARGEAWADIRLWGELGLQPGMQVEVGKLHLRITALLDYEPDRGAGFFDLAPRLLINAADVPSSGLVGPGSRVQYTLMLAGEPAALAQLHA